MSEVDEIRNRHSEEPWSDGSGSNCRECHGRRFPCPTRSAIDRIADELERLYIDRRLSGQANYLLARIVAAANLGAIDGADGFVDSYSLPVGPIHKAIPFLQEQGIVVTVDGQIKNSTNNLT